MGSRYLPRFCENSLTFWIETLLSLRPVTRRLGQASNIARFVRLSGCVSDQQALKVSAIQNPDVYSRVTFPEESNLAVLARHQGLAKCRDLQVEVMIRQVEVRRKGRSGISV